MRTTIAIVLMTFGIDVLAQTPAPVVSPDWAAQAAAPQVTDQAIKEAVRDTIAEESSASPREQGDVFRTERSDRFERKFEEARVPGCLRPDGLKHQPPRIGPIGLGGILALPFLALAKIRGKCH